MGRMPARSQAPRARPAAPPVSSNRTPMRPGGGSSAAANAQIEDLTNQLMESKLTIEGLEKKEISISANFEILKYLHKNTKLTGVNLPREPYRCFTRQKMDLLYQKMKQV